MYLKNSQQSQKQSTNIILFYIITILFTLSSFNIYINRTPAVCFDVDGVLKKGIHAFPGAKESLIKLK